MRTPPTETRAGRRLLQLGVTLFLLGLLTGFAIPLMSNPRMGLSSHLEGVLNGMFLVILGLLWDRLRLGTFARTTAVLLAIYGTFANWGATLLAAVWGAGETMPIAGAGQRGTPLQEVLIAVALWSLSLCMVTVCGIVLFGLREEARETARRRQAEPHPSH